MSRERINKLLNQIPTHVIILLTILIWIKHRANIARLIAGTEPRIGASK